MIHDRLELCVLGAQRSFSLGDADANQYKPAGAFAEVNKDGGSPTIVGNFDFEGGGTGVERGNDPARAKRRRELPRIRAAA